VKLLPSPCQATEGFGMPFYRNRDQKISNNATHLWPMPAYSHRIRPELHSRIRVLDLPVPSLRKQNSPTGPGPQVLPLQSQPHIDPDHVLTNHPAVG